MDTQKGRIIIHPYHFSPAIVSGYESRSTMVKAIMSGGESRLTKVKTGVQPAGLHASTAPLKTDAHGITVNDHRHFALTA